jgi:hypothetical protein
LIKYGCRRVHLPRRQFFCTSRAGISDPKRLLRPIVFAVLLTALKSPVEAGETNSSTAPVCFDGFVNWDFHHRQNLEAWKTTALAIQRTLDAWHLTRSNHPLVENGPPEVLRQFLHGLPSEDSCDINLVYLASHQSRAAEWDFIPKKVVPLNSIINETQIRPHSRRVVILDTCFAAAAQSQIASAKTFAPIFLFASTASQETPMVNFHTPQPVDFAHRYPATFVWLKECLGKKWDGKISFLGFVWVETFLTVKNRPVEIRDWINFLQACQSTARQFRENVSQKSSSEVLVSVD